jgi:hypothetical protein
MSGAILAGRLIVVVIPEFSNVIIFTILGTSLALIIYSLLKKIKYEGITYEKRVGTCIEYIRYFVMVICYYLIVLVF